VFPPVPGYLLAYTILYLPFSFIIPQGIFYNIVMGVMIGYQIYDEMHYFMHHSNPKPGYLKTVKMYHMQHHYKFGSIGFGISSKFWDIVFLTEIKTEKRLNKKIY